MDGLEHGNQITFQWPTRCIWKSIGGPYFRERDPAFASRHSRVGWPNSALAQLDSRTILLSFDFFFSTRKLVRALQRDRKKNQLRMKKVYAHNFNIIFFFSLIFVFYLIYLHLRLNRQNTSTSHKTDLL
jgi:hypothetical protein